MFLTYFKMLARNINDDTRDFGFPLETVKPFRKDEMSISINLPFEQVTLVRQIRDLSLQQLFRHPTFPTSVRLFIWTFHTYHVSHNKSWMFLRLIFTTSKIKLSLFHSLTHLIVPLNELTIGPFYTYGVHDFKRYTLSINWCRNTKSEKHIIW